MTVNGITVSENYLSSEPVDASYLPEARGLRRRAALPLRHIRIYGTVEISATSASASAGAEARMKTARCSRWRGEAEREDLRRRGSSVSVNGVELDELQDRRKADRSLPGRPGGLRHGAGLEVLG